MTIKLTPLAAALVALFVLVLPGCGAAGDPNTLTLYNAQHPETTAALVKAFTAKTGIAVRIKSADEALLTAQLEQEGTRSPADVFYAENSNWLAQLDERRLLAPVAAATLTRVPRRDSATDGRWLGLSGRFSVLVYNPSKLTASQLPRTVLQLANPRYKGLLELAPAETDFWPIIASIARADGTATALQWLEAIKSNAGSNASAADNETLVSDVSKGLSGLGLINHYYYYRLRAEEGAGSTRARLALLAPGDPGYVEDISGAAILSSSHNKAAAQRFLAFLASAAGQRMLAASDSFEYPLLSGAAPNRALPPRSVFHPTAITPAQLGTGLSARALLRKAGLI